MALCLSEQQAWEMARQASAHAPAESCGLIAGHNDRAALIIPIPNVAADPVHCFEMEPGALVKTLFEIERRGQRLIGIYHSHPAGEPVPSPTDIREACYPDVAYVIVGLASGVPCFSAWQIRNNEVERAELQIGPVSSDDDREQSLSTVQRFAIILSMVVAAIFVILLSLSLLPPAPEIP